MYIYWFKKGSLLIYSEFFLVYHSVKIEGLRQNKHCERSCELLVMSINKIILCLIWNLSLHSLNNTMVNPESSHVRIDWISVISVWYQLISVDISGIPVFPSVISHCSGISAVWYQLISVWYQLISVDISWYQLISVGYQFPPLWYHTLNLISPWIKLISNLMIQGFNPCIKRKSHR